MVYRKRYRYGRKRRYKKKSYSPLDYKVSLRQVWNKTKYLASMINSEKKYFDVNINSNQTVASDSTYVDCLTEVTQGDNYNNRDGDSILAKSIQMRGVVAVDTASTAASVRIMIVLVRALTGEVPSAASLLEDPDNYLSPLLHHAGSKYNVLKDMTIDLDTTDKPHKSFKCFIPLQEGTHIKYTEAVELKNNIYIFAISSLASASNPPTIQYYSRLRFYDN